MSEKRITCGMRVSLAKFDINNYTFLDNFLHFSQRTRYLGLNISIISEFQKNLSSSFLNPHAQNDHQNGRSGLLEAVTQVKRDTEEGLNCRKIYQK